MDTTELALAARQLGKRYRRGWALRECALELPAGRVAALVGPNGAGKTTLMRLAVGLIAPSHGWVRVVGAEPGSRDGRTRVAYLAQDKPLYRAFTVAETLRAARALNPRWDQAHAERLVRDAQVPLFARVGTLSGGQRTQVALAVALARRPDLVLLDEPLADLDPLARQEFLQTLMADVAETGMSVLLSSHLLTDLEDVCDHLLLLANGRTQLAGDVADLVATHQLMVGPAGPGPLPFPAEAVIEARTAGRQATVMVRSPWSVGLAPGWERHEPTLAELTLSYLRAARAAGVAGPGGVAGLGGQEAAA